MAMILIDVFSLISLSSIDDDDVMAISGWWTTNAIIESSVVKLN